MGAADSAFTGRAAADGIQLALKVRASRPVDRAIDSAAALQGAVGRVYDGIDLLDRDVALDDWSDRPALPPAGVCGGV